MTQKNAVGIVMRRRNRYDSSGSILMRFQEVGVIPEAGRFRHELPLQAKHGMYHPVHTTKAIVEEDSRALETQVKLILFPKQSFQFINSPSNSLLGRFFNTLCY